jgi:1-pyrroline-5-carboxylate dehydrogenase
MSTGFFKIPTPANEPILSYAPGSKERVALKKALAEARANSVRYTYVYRCRRSAHRK